MVFLSPTLYCKDSAPLRSLTAHLALFPAPVLPAVAQVIVLRVVATNRLFSTTAFLILNMGALDTIFAPVDLLFAVQPAVANAKLVSANLRTLPQSA